ncbi:MAG: O-antigen ligase family protein [Patescibacteria group bacterium]|nr:O-antigen ligase family protein [Patescibacteria group bacterium]
MKLLNKIIALSFYCLFIIVPLILTPYNYELFEFNKMLTVYFLTVIITSAWIIKMILSRKILVSRTPFDLPLLLFLLSQIISSILSINPHTSVWGYYSRFHGGLMSTLSYLLLYYAFVSNQISVKNSLKVILSTAAIVSLYGIAEHFGIDKTIWVQDVQNRVFSTLGQPNWLAAYLIALVPLSGRLSPLLLLTLFFTKSQSGLGTAAIILLLMFILMLIKQRSLKIILLTALLIGGTYYFLTSPLTANMQKTRQLINQENKIHDAGSSSLLIRRVVWQGAINTWRHYPLFGSGVETFAYSYYNFRPQEHNLLSEWDFLYNKAHNEYLNFLATTGAFGLVAYLLFIISVLIFFIKNLKSKNTTLTGLFLGFVSILITNFFGFAVVPVALFFFMFPAFAYTLSTTIVVKSVANNPTNFSQYLLIGLILFFTFSGLKSTLNLWKADYQFNLGRNYVKANQLQKGLAFLQQAVQLSPQEPLFKSEYAEGLAKLAYVYNATPAAQLALDQSNQVLAANPVHLNYYKSRLKILLLLNNLDPQYLQPAIDTTLQAIKLAPTDAKLYYNLALMYQQNHQTDLAKTALIKTIELKPNYDAAISALQKLNLAN